MSNELIISQEHIENRILTFVGCKLCLMVIWQKCANIYKSRLNEQVKET